MKATPRPLIKWKSFWLGILVLGLLGWAWKHSLTHFFMIERIRESNVMYFGQSIGTVSMGHTVLSPPDEYGDAFWTFSNEETPYSFKLSLEPAFRFEGGGMELAHWFLILLFLVPWTAWLFWHWKREQKKGPSAFS